jgi:hypothetical protein
MSAVERSITVIKMENNRHVKTAAVFIVPFLIIYFSEIFGAKNDVFKALEYDG